MSSLPTFADVQAAARRLDGVTIRTPLLENERVNRTLGGRLFIKAECLQRTGSFKLRGAYNFLAAMSEADRAKGVVGWSSGNHAQGLAEAARLLGVKATIVMPADAPLLAAGPATESTPADAPLLSRGPGMEPTGPTSATSDEGAASPAARLASESTRADNPVTPTPPTRALQLLVDADPAIPPVDSLMPVAPHQAAAARRSSVPRPGRGLVIASGVTLGVGVALGVSAGLIDGRMNDTRRALYELNASVGNGYATEAQDTSDNGLRADYKTLTHQRAALALGAGATLVVAIVLAAVGGRKMARSASRAALLPAPGGLVFRGRF